MMRDAVTILYTAGSSWSSHYHAPICRPRRTGEDKNMQRGSIDRKDRLHDEFLAALDVLDAEQREPDRWEEECLSYALGAMACGMYLVAEVELDAFRRPLTERSPEVSAALAAKPAHFTKAMLRQGLDYVQQHYGHPVDSGIDMPPALVAGQLAFRALATPS